MWTNLVLQYKSHTLPQLHWLYQAARLDYKQFPSSVQDVFYHTGTKNTVLCSFGEGCPSLGTCGEQRVEPVLWWYVSWIWIRPISHSVKYHTAFDGKVAGGKIECNISISVYSYPFPSAYPGAAVLHIFSGNHSLQCFCLRVQGLILSSGVCLCVWARFTEKMTP